MTSQLIDVLQTTNGKGLCSSYITFHNKKTNTMFLFLYIELLSMK